MVRVNKPALVDPAHDHDRVFAEDMGIATARTIGKRTSDLTKEKVQGGKPPVLTGSWTDDTAGQALAILLHESGIIIDATEYGYDPTLSVANSAYSFDFAAQSAADTVSTTSTTIFSTAISMLVTLGPGIWTVDVWGGLLLSHSASGTIDRRVTFGSALGGIQTASNLTTREHYAINGTRPLTPGDASYTATIEYRCGTAGTAGARAPWIGMSATRTA